MGVRVGLPGDGESVIRVSGPKYGRTGVPLMLTSLSSIR